MKKIKIFLASSDTLSEERIESETLLYRKNDKLIDKGIYLQLVIWEKISKNFSKKRKQNEFNQAITESDIFICLVFDKVGQFTHEEFLKAYKSFKKHKKPKRIYIFFKDSQLKTSEIKTEFQAVLEFKEEIKKHKQIYGKYENVKDLLHQFDNNLQSDFDELIGEIPKFFPTYRFLTNNEEIYTESIPLLDKTKSRIRALIYANGPKAPVDWNNNLAKLLATRHKSKKPVQFDIVVCIKPDQIDDGFFKRTDERLKPFIDKGVIKYFHNSYHIM